jgi:hypothetical protein
MMVLGLKKHLIIIFTYFIDRVGLAWPDSGQEPDPTQLTHSPSHHSPHTRTPPSVPLVAAVSPPFPSRSRPSPAPMRWGSASPRRAQHPCLDRFDPRGLLCLPLTSEP